MIGQKEPSKCKNGLELLRKKMQPSNISYKYIIAAACFGTQAVGIGLFISYGVFINPLIEEFGWPRAAISGASSLSFFLMGLLGIFVGRLNDKIGPRKVMLVTSCFILSLIHI